MSEIIGLWSIGVPGGQRRAITPLNDLELSNIALGLNILSPFDRTTVMLVYPDSHASDGISTIVLCSLVPRKVEQAFTKVVLKKDIEYVFDVIGLNEAHLFGHYLAGSAENNPVLTTQRSDAITGSAEITSALTTQCSDTKQILEGETEGKVEDSSYRRAKRVKSVGSRSNSVQPSVTLQATSAKHAHPRKSVKRPHTNDSTQVNNATMEKFSFVSKDHHSTASEVQFQDLAEGSGDLVQAGMKVLLWHIVRSDGKVLQSNTKGIPTSLSVGSGSFIPGFDEAIIGTRVGGERRITIPQSKHSGNVFGFLNVGVIIVDCKVLEVVKL